MWPAIAAVGGAIAVAKILSSDADHDDVVSDTVGALEAEAPSDASIYADGVDGVPSPHGEVDGIVEHVPDVVVKSGVANNLIVEVETADSLEERDGDARSQLREFSTRGYRRVLVVPDGDGEQMAAFMEDVNERIDGTIHTATPEDVAELL